MNGWDPAEPAWWLNLQDQPDAIAQTRDGARQVRLFHTRRPSERGERSSCCDWIVVADDVVVLVEVKCGRPNPDYRTGGAAGFADAKEKLGKAVDQLEKTAKRIAERHPAFEHIPADRPVRGLIVTLEPF